MFVQEERYGPRLPMTLCYFSSQDEAHPAEALRYQTKRSAGWQSGKHCRFPQELGFRFDGQVSLDRIRVLAHQSKISSCIDVYVADASEAEVQNGVCDAYASVSFTRLGHVRFSTNKRNNFMARELKTICVNRRCTYLKLSLRRPHHNDYNLFQQVGIVGITAHGTVVRTFNSWMDQPESILVGEIIEIPLDEMLPITEETTVQSNTTAEDAESSTNRRVKELRALKARAVAEEDYDVADALRIQIEAVESSGKQIAQLEEEKNRAVEAEDYRRAKELKQRIDALRSNSTYKPPVAEAAHAEKGSALESSSRQPTRGATIPSDDVIRAAPAPVAAAAPQPRKSGRGGNGNDEVVVGGKGYYDVDDATGGLGGAFPQQGVHASISVNGEGEQWEKALNTAIVKLCPDQSSPTPLTGEALSEGQPYERIFGVYCVSCLFARRGQLREAGVRGISSDEGLRALSSHTTSAPDSLLAYIGSKGRGLSDAAAGVVFASCEAILKAVKGDFAGAPPLTQLFGSLSKVVQPLVARIGDANNRIRESVEEVVITLARSPFGAEKITALLLVDPDKQAKKPANFRAHVSRVNIISTFVDEFGLNRLENPQALDVHALVSRVVLPSMHHSNGDVRDAAVNLFAKLAILDPTTCRPYLEGVKPAQQALVEQRMLAAKDGGQATSSADDPEMDADTVSVLSRGHLNPPTPVARRKQRATSIAGQGSRAHSNTDLISHQFGTEIEYRALHTCQFCAEYNPDITEDNIDTHYVRFCPMLCRCPLCDQVTEICTLQQHLVSECDGRHLVRECPRCREAVRAEDIKDHVAAKKCMEAVPAFSICPLCHARFKSGMGGWRSHLARAPGCPHNPRKYDGSGPSLQ